MMNALKAEFVANKIRTAPVAETVIPIVDILTTPYRVAGNIIVATHQALCDKADDVGKCVVSAINVFGHLRKTINTVEMVNDMRKDAKESEKKVRELWQSWLKPIDMEKGA